jgi:CNT family concentrative nucleoside transporter
VKQFLSSNRNVRILALVAAVALTLAAFLGAAPLGGTGRALLGVLALLFLSVSISRAPTAISMRTVVVGLGLQVLCAVLVLRTGPGAAILGGIAEVVEQFLAFSDAGSRFVFGSLADPDVMGEVFGPARAFVFAVRALPTIIFVSSVFTVLYYFGVLQWVVRIMARVMSRLMGTSGAESLAAAANVFMGQTEAPLLVKPYIATMTRSELLAMMGGGFATISGGMMAVYIQMGADARGLLTASVMAAPCSLLLAKVLYPEQEKSPTRGVVQIDVEREDRNAIDAAARGATDGLKLALNVAAVLIAFLAWIALMDYLLSAVHLRGSWGESSISEWLAVGWPGRAVAEGSAALSLGHIFSVLFAPLALLTGVPLADVPEIAHLLGTKLVANEFVAYSDLTLRYGDVIAPSSTIIATFALCGFANLGSIGVQIGGISAIAPGRRSELAQLGLRALYCGFVATLINAAIAGILLQ